MQFVLNKTFLLSTVKYRDYFPTSKASKYQSSIAVNELQSLIERRV